MCVLVEMSITVSRIIEGPVPCIQPMFTSVLNPGAQVGGLRSHRQVCGILRRYDTLRGGGGGGGVGGGGSAETHVLACCRISVTARDSSAPPRHWPAIASGLKGNPISARGTAPPVPIDNGTPQNQ